MTEQTFLHLGEVQASKNHAEGEKVCGLFLDDQQKDIHEILVKVLI